MTQHNSNLSLNQQGKDVALLQSRLIDIGYAITTLEILNEFFGEGTYQAVLQFQQREGLDPSGEVDPLTSETLINRKLRGGGNAEQKAKVPDHLA